MIFMLFALAHTFLQFKIKSLLPDTIRMVIAAVLIIGAGVLASYIPLPVGVTGQSLAVFRLIIVGAACLLVAWPSLTKTGSLDPAESRALFGSLLRRGSPVPADASAGKS